MEFTLRIRSQCSANSRGDPCADLWSTFHAKLPPFQNSALNFQLPLPPQASSSISTQRGPAVFPSLLLCSAKKAGQSEGHLSCFSSPRVHSPVPPVPQSLKTVDSQSSAWKQSVPFSSCLWWEVKFNPYYSQIVQQEWEQCKYHGLICLVSECPSELCERKPDSPALLVCLGVLGLLWAEVHPVFKEMYFSYNMAPQCKSVDSCGAHSKNKDLSSQEEEVPGWTSWDIVCYSPVEQTFQGPFLL